MTFFLATDGVVRRACGCPEGEGHGFLCEENPYHIARSGDERMRELYSAGYLGANGIPTDKGLTELYRLLKLAQSAEAERDLHNTLYGRSHGGSRAAF